MPRGYIPILIFLAIAAAFPIVTIMAAKLVRPSAPSKVKLEAYECGIPADADTRGRYSIRFYLVAILFVIFDVETIFLIPWAVEMRDLGWGPFVAVSIFVAVLALGLVYEWKKGGLEWD